MTTEKMKKGLAEYKKKLEAGEIQRTKALTPIEKAKANPRSLRYAINAKCFDCSCYQRTEVTECSVLDCPLYQLRPWQR